MANTKKSLLYIRLMLVSDITQIRPTAHCGNVVHGYK